MPVLSSQKSGRSPQRTRETAAVGIISSSRYVRESLMNFLTARDPHLIVVDLFAGGHETLERIERLRPDVVILDLPVPHSPNLIQQVGSRSAHSQVLVVGIQENTEEVLRLAEAGAIGFLPRDASLDELVRCVYRAITGDLSCSPRTIAALARRVTKLAESTQREVSPPLSVRERQILELIDQGLPNKEIAGRLSIELPTVKNHVHHILEKLAVHRRGEAAAQARGSNPSLRLVRTRRRSQE